MNTYPEVLVRCGDRLVPLTTLVTFYLKPGVTVGDSGEGAAVTFNDVVREFLLARGQDGVSARHLEGTRVRLNRIGRDLGERLITEFTAAVIDYWLRETQRGTATTGRTRNHFRAAFSNLMKFAKQRGYLPRHWDEMPFVSKAKEVDGEIGIYSVADLRRILRQPMQDDLLLYVIFGAFAGLRPSEISRLKWRDVHWDAREIFVGTGKVRTAGHRVAPLLSAAEQWLLQGKIPYTPRSELDLVTPLANYNRRLQRVFKGASVTFVPDGFRHSYISYRHAICKDLQRVSSETGTSPGTLTRRYCRPVSATEAEAWFNTTPQTEIAVGGGTYVGS